jgi:hypothetical protein
MLSFAAPSRSSKPSNGAEERKIAPTLYSAKELSRRVKQEQAFVTRVLAQRRPWLIGDEGALAA